MGQRWQLLDNIGEFIHDFFNLHFPVTLSITQTLSHTRSLFLCLSPFITQTLPDYIFLSLYLYLHHSYTHSPD